MTLEHVVTAVVGGTILISVLSVLFAPQSVFPTFIRDLGDAWGGVLQKAKAVPS